MVARIEKSVFKGRQAMGKISNHTKKEEEINEDPSDGGWWMGKGWFGQEEKEKKRDTHKAKQ